MEKTFFRKAGFVFGFSVCIVALLVIIANLNVEPSSETEAWQCVQVWSPLGAEGDPGAGASGFLEIFFMNLSSADVLGYGLNTSSTHETWSDANMPGASPNAWASADNFDITSFESEKTFVFMVRVRYNATHAKDGANWNGADTDVQITVTCTSWKVGANINNVSGTRIETSNNSAYTFLYENFYWDNGGTGYQISDDAKMTTSEVYIEAKF